MDWTKEKPTKPGRYALKEFGQEHKIRLCEVFDLAGMMYATRRDQSLFTIQKHTYLADEWLGPLDDKDVTP